MSHAQRVTEARILIESYGASSALVRLAELSSPACRIEPQLLRQLRLLCLPDADVSIEQELWHCDLVNARGKTITFHAEVAGALRGRLRELRRQRPEVVERARMTMAALHTELPPLLILEDQLAWAEVFDDDQSIRSGASTLLRSLLARREGLDHWLGRAWTALPASLKELPEGKQLAQVAAAEGAEIDDDGVTPPAADAVAHILPLISLPLKVEGLRLEFNVPPAAASHVLEIPDTRPRALSVISAAGSEDLVFSETEVRGIEVGSGVVIIRTLAGTEYELEAFAHTSVFEVEMLAAGHGTSLMIRYGTGSARYRVLVDCGTQRTGKRLSDRFRDAGAEAEPVELLVLTHIDDDRIGGAVPLLQTDQFTGQLREVWFNGPPQMPLAEGLQRP